MRRMQKSLLLAALRVAVATQVGYVLQTSFAYLDRKSMFNNGLLGSYYRFWAMSLISFGAQVVRTNQIPTGSVCRDLEKE